MLAPLVCERADQILLNMMPSTALNLVDCGTKHSMILSNRHNWKKKGFLSRTIPFSYSYGINTINKVFESILDLDYMKEQEVKLNIPKQDVEIRLPEKYARAILPSITMIAKAQETYGFRLQKQFQALLQASALDRGRRVVNRSDVDRVLRLMNWVNFDEKPIA